VSPPLYLISGGWILPGKYLLLKFFNSKMKENPKVGMIYIEVNMNRNENKLEGFIFLDINEYEEAQKEAESIEYIKANNDLEDYNKLVKLYYKLVEQNCLRTPVGVIFLKQLQERILKEGIVSSTNLPGIQINKITPQNSIRLKSVQQSQKQIDPVKDYRIKLRNSRIISLFLIVIIFIMILMAVFTDRTIYTNYEKKILNKYATWEEDLNVREKDLQNKEDLQSVD
jgi:hypothetical protein